jgi:L-ascorbate oxidase
LTMNHVQTRILSVFHPGYRHDAMVAFPTTNRYCLFDTKLNIDDEINAPLPNVGPQIAPNHRFNAQLLGWVNVKAAKTKAQSDCCPVPERSGTKNWFKQRHSDPVISA